jgi:hypothetical protein
MFGGRGGAGKLTKGQKLRPKRNGPKPSLANSIKSYGIGERLSHGLISRQDGKGVIKGWKWAEWKPLRQMHSSHLSLTSLAKN